MTQAWLEAATAGTQVTPDRARIAVYSCWFGDYEPFNPAATGPDGKQDRIVFTDRPQAVDAPGVRVVALTDPAKPPAILSRLPKLCPHRFLASYDWVIYVDNNATLRKTARQIVRFLDKRLGGDLPPGRFLFEHHRRDCAYDEIDACRSAGSIDPADADRLAEDLTVRGFPRHWGLFANTCLVQRMGSPETDALNEAWYASLTTQTRRDQVYLPYLLWSAQCPYKVVPGFTRKLIEWPLYGAKARAAHRARAGTATSRDFPIPGGWKS
jgi:hypothetical protein